MLIIVLLNCGNLKLTHMRGKRLGLSVWKMISVCQQCSRQVKMAGQVFWFLVVLSGGY